MSAQEHATQATHGAAQAASHGGGHAASEGFNAGETIIDHVSNSSLDHPLIHLPTIAGIDLSVTKHVFMLWLVAAVVFVIVTTVVRRFLRSGRPVPTGFMSALEAVVIYVRDEIVQPNVGRKWVNTWTPLLLTLFVFILSANAIGLIPLFDVVALVDHYVLHTGAGLVPEERRARRHDGDGELQRHGGAGDDHLRRDHRGRHEGARVHQALEEPRAARPRMADLHPADSHRDHGDVRAAVRAHDATCGQHDGRPHRDSRDSVVRVPVRARCSAARSPESAVGMVVSVPLAVGISALEIIVVLVQAYVFTLLTAVFIGMAIHVHH